jgi:hypothetical protein
VLFPDTDERHRYARVLEIHQPFALISNSSPQQVRDHTELVVEHPPEANCRDHHRDRPGDQADGARDPPQPEVGVQQVRDCQPQRHLEKGRGERISVVRLSRADRRKLLKLRNPTYARGGSEDCTVAG